ncbi:capsid cement protein [Bradyrhizobium sp.]|uniref:capsid cement protein n=1 Tax=Bradyrhizobium sp. TaxID=376 RepID=UPI001ED28753|nr:capsid cement protein [Bradyrhizobium sp.]MBV9984517.1 DUF2190 family protein [Bradyrhizobium sp.]
MAAETPLIHDGSQCVAAANYFNPAVPLNGPFGSGQFLAVAISAARTVAVQTAQGGAMYGVLQNTPPAGIAADVGIGGISKMVAGAAVAAGAELMVDANGRFITWVAGAGNAKVGLALEAAAGANAVITGLIYVPNVKALT